MRPLSMSDQLASPAPVTTLNLPRYILALYPCDKMTDPNQSPCTDKPMFHHGPDNRSAHHGFGKQWANRQRIGLKVVVHIVYGAPRLAMGARGTERVEVSELVDEDRAVRSGYVGRGGCVHLR